jgi:hypothetical protein
MGGRLETAAANSLFDSAPSGGGGRDSAALLSEVKAEEHEATAEQKGVAEAR